LDQPGLPRARLTDDLDELAASVRRAVERRLKGGQLLAPPDDRQRTG
jgi:hypothetical protein